MRGARAFCFRRLAKALFARGIMGADVFAACAVFSVVAAFFLCAVQV